MIRNILAFIGVLAVIMFVFMGIKMPGMMSLMPSMMGSGMAPIVEKINENPQGLIDAASNLADGASEETASMLSKWVESKGEIATTTTWAWKVEEGVTTDDINDVLETVATERNIKNVGILPLSDELQARGVESGYLKVYSYCNPETARKMVTFAPNMAAYLPCRLTVVEKEDGLWIYTLNMDMMLKMGQNLKAHPELKAAADAVRETIWEMGERASKGEF